MRKWIVAGVFVLTLGLLAQTSLADDSHGQKVLAFKTMAGVVPPYTGAANPIRGIPGGGAAWRIDKAHGILRADGDLEIRVEGLVLTSHGNESAARVSRSRQLPVDRERIGRDHEPGHSSAPGDYCRRCIVRRQREPAEPVPRADRLRDDRSG